MNIRFPKKYYTDPEKTLFQGWYIFCLMIKGFKINWFTDCGEWFFYIYIGKRHWRFSSAGFIKGKIK